MRVTRVPEDEEIERAVRAWLVEIEAASSVSLSGTGPDAHDQIRALKHLDAEVIRVMRAGTGETPLMARWIADALIDAHGWSVPHDGLLRSTLERQVARGQNELAVSLKAELAWETSRASFVTP